MTILSAIFLSLIAGFLGTVVMTISQFIEIGFTKRSSSFTPAMITSRLLGINFERLSEKAKVALNYATHFGYGTLLGVLVPLLLYALGSQGATMVIIINALIVWVQGLIVVPVLGSLPPPWQWGTKWVIIDAFHHFVLGASTAVIYLFFARP